MGQTTPNGTPQPGQVTTQTSGFGKLNWKDALKGFVVAVITAVLTAIYGSISAGSLTFNWKEIATVGITAGVGYLLKNVFTSSQTILKMLFILVVALALLPKAGRAQTPFKALPLLPTDSVYNAYRFTANFSPGGYTFGGTYQVMAGMEFGYQHIDYNYGTQQHKVLWSANFAWFPLNSSNPIKSLQDLTSIAALVGIDNNLIQIGPMWNPNAPAKQQWGVCASVGITLNN